MQYDTAVDYLTVTFRCVKEWTDSVYQIAKIVDLNAKRRPWFFYGYSGFSQSDEEGHYARGKGTRGGIVQASGAVSDILCREYDRWLPDRVHFTRVDLALTFTLNRRVPLVREAADFPRDDWTVVLPHGDRGGGTLYVGNRKSSTFGRLYDKGAELNQRLPKSQQIETEYLWRAELETKKDSAKAIFSALVKAQASCSVREFIANTTLAWFSERGVYLPIIPGAHSIVSVAHRAVDDLRTIKWLHEQVRPAVWRLAENGKIADVAEALNVQPQNFALDAPLYLSENYNQFSFFDKFS
jgi:DNA relaxase NicK